MSILSMLVANPLDGEKKPWKPWYGHLLLVVLVVSGGLYVYQRVNGGSVIPALTDPTTIYENAKAVMKKEIIMRDEAQYESTDDALSSVVKATLKIIETTPIVLPDTKDFSGDAVTLAAWIEQSTATVRATVIEDPSADEMAAYLVKEIPVLVPVMFAEETIVHWVVLDALSQTAVLAAMIGNRVVVVEAK